MKFRALVVSLLASLLSPAGLVPIAASTSGQNKLDAVLRDRVAKLTGVSRVIVTATDDTALASLVTLVKGNGGKARRKLASAGSQVVDVPNSLLPTLATMSGVVRLVDDRPAVGALERTSLTIGATAVRDELGYTGAGITVATIDSGITSHHDDLSGSDGDTQRVVRFVDFVSGLTESYDDYGHGTHVAGIIAGNGHDSEGARSGIAPDASLVVLKVLDGNGNGYISDVIAALDYAVSHKDELNIRVINLSVASAVYESYDTDPLTLAARRAVEAGVVVVAAAGNNGHSAQGQTQYGGITAPGNAPWVLTVGASSHMGTADRSDDTIASFSSRGPSAIDFGAKPDLVAPGVGIESLSDPASAFYLSKGAYLRPGTVPTSYLPYLSLSGTSMAAPVVSGTVALMLQANPSLTPNAVKAILQYTAQVYAGYDPLTQGAGFLNARGAVELARFFDRGSDSVRPSSADWGRRLIWGNRLITGGELTADANAWRTDVMWGATTGHDGDPISWGAICSASPCDGDAPRWQLDVVDVINVVWGPLCDGADCTFAWDARTVSASSSDGDTVVWGTSADGDTVVWGTSADGDTVVWGTSCSDTSCEPVIWPR
jgi:serine protease AprX